MNKLRGSKELIKTLLKKLRTLRIPSKNLINCGLLSILALILLFAFFVRYEGNLIKFFDTLDYAQIARNIVRGEGYTTKLVTPLSWSVVPQIPHPELWRPPVFPHLVALGFLILGINSTVPFIVSAASYLITILLVYFLVLRFTNSRAALLSSLLVLLSPFTFQMGVLGTTESTFTMLFLASLVSATRKKPSPSLLALICGLMYLTRFNAWFFVLGSLVVAAKNSKRQTNFILWFLIVFLMTLTPWAIHGWYFTGQFLYHHQIHQILSGTAKPEGWGIFFYFDLPDPLQYTLQHPFQLFFQWIRGLYDSYQVFVEIISSYWPPVLLALTGIILPGNSDFHRTRQLKNDLWILFGIILATQTVLLSAVLINLRLFVPILPVVVVLAAIVVAKTIRFHPFSGYVILLCVAGFFSYELMTLDFSRPSIPVKNYSQISQYVPKEEPILSNKYFFLPWYTDRVTLAPPKNYESSSQHYPEFDYVFLQDDPRVLASRIHRNIHRKYRSNPDFRNDFDPIRRFKSGGILYERK